MIRVHEPAKLLRDCGRCEIETCSLLACRLVRHKCVEIDESNQVFDFELTRIHSEDF